MGQEDRRQKRNLSAADAGVPDGLPEEIIDDGAIPDSGPKAPVFEPLPNPTKVSIEYFRAKCLRKVVEVVGENNKFMRYIYPVDVDWVTTPHEDFPHHQPGLRLLSIGYFPIRRIKGAWSVEQKRSVMVGNRLRFAVAEQGETS